MKRWLFDYLVCPKCKKPLKMLSDGGLTCDCGSSFPIEKGVPVFVKSDMGKMKATADAFSSQWRFRNRGLFHDEGIYGFSIEDYINHFKYVFKISDLRSLEGKTILEAGCGPGEMIAAIGGETPGVRLIGLDISDALYNASEKAVSLDNVCYVHADLLRPPFKPNCFDYIFSAGVLHHTPSVYESVRSLFGLLKPEGKLYVWLYPSYQFCVYDFTRRLIPFGWRLPAPARLMISWFLAPFLKLFFIVTKLHSQKTATENLATIALRIFDNISPEFQSRHSKEEVEQWLAKLNPHSYEIVNDLGFIIIK